MDQDPEMNRSVFLIASALNDFASSKNWSEFDYWIFFKTNPDIGRVYFTFVAKGFDDLDPYDCTREVWAYLQTALSGHPDVLKSLGLVVRSKKKVDEGGLYAVGTGYTEFYTMYPAKAR